MASEALLYSSNASVILANEPGTDAIDRERPEQALNADVALSDAGDLTALELRKDRNADKPFLADAELMSRIAKMGRNGRMICSGHTLSHRQINLELLSGERDEAKRSVSHWKRY